MSRRAAVVGLAAGLGLAAAPAGAAVQCARTVRADVVVLDQPLMFNRLGSQNVNGIVYALRGDLVDLTGLPLSRGGLAAPGNVALRPDKRPRPLTLRVAAGDCLEVQFQNLLSPAPNPFRAPVDGQVFALPLGAQVVDRTAGFHPQGLELLTGIQDDGSEVGQNASSLVAPGAQVTYRYFAPKEGAFLVTSHGATFGGEGTSGNGASGMFAVVNVEPPGASFYRSQVTEEELRLATRLDAGGQPLRTDTGQPVVDYAARYPSAEPWQSEGKAGQPILAMLDGSDLVHSDLNAIVTGPNADGSWPSGPAAPYPLERVGLRNPTVPNRLEPFREFTVVFHDESAVANAFPRFFLDPVLKHTLRAVGDVFQVNYGAAAVGSEIIANRLGVGPMHDCLDCAYEEFFLTSYAVGDPAMVVDRPANLGLELCAPGVAPGTGPCSAIGPKATKAFYPADPSNVHHSYISDFVKFRNVHSGREHHVFHLHNHQWLFNPSDDNANYIDAQGIGPGAGYTYEINFGGSGNRNKSAGDAIFHCHFYPHFAQGMWELWRIHDTFEAGTRLAVSGDGFHQVPFALQDGQPAAAVVDPASGAITTPVRALPDGEIAGGTPIPALVPLPGKALAPMPGRVAVVPKVEGGVTLGSNARVDRTDTDPTQVHATLNPTGLRNPGYPFWIAGIEHVVGQRAPTPPLDMALDPQDPADGGWDGGLPRHALDGYAAAGCATTAGRAACAHSEESPLSFAKEVVLAKPVWFPEDGTDVEKAAMAFHAVRQHPSSSYDLAGALVPAAFVTNGSGRPVPGAPYHDPCIDDTGAVLHDGVTGHFFDAQGGFGTTGASPFSADHPRHYKGANIQFDAVLNKVGYHYPQQRILALWEDAVPTITKARAPEPLVMRMNTFDCVMYSHTNLIPHVFELDDYQVRTPTDIVGQHIHLPKWDLTTTDGSANGWNYEDGTLSPGAVQERIAAINAFNPGGAGNPGDSAGRDADTPLLAADHPYFGRFGKPEWRGARTTLQRWYSDPVVNAMGVHRGLGVIFSHDHYGPSTHQQVGLYATVLVEPPGSTWVHNETGAPLYDTATRRDGGPTSWQAAILTGDLDADGQNDSYREFYFEFSDFQHAYLPGVYVGRDQAGNLAAGPTDATFRSAINPSARVQAATVLPDLVVIPALCPSGLPRPCPEAITAEDPGTLVVNYRNEPVALRVFDPARLGPDGKPGSQAAGLAGDLAFALQSRTDRVIRALNTQPRAGASLAGTTFPPPLQTAGVGPGDPFTPMPRSYFGDRVRLKVQAGGDEESHNVSVLGMKWLQEGAGYGFSPNSGWRSAQHAGISEQFTFATPVLPLLRPGASVDYAYTMNASIDGYWHGVWGLMRSYRAARADLFRLPNSTPNLTVANQSAFVEVCPRTARIRAFDVTAAMANEVLPNALGVTIVPADASATLHTGGALDPAGGTLVYNPRATLVQGQLQQAEPLPGEPEPPPVFAPPHSGPLHDPTALLYLRTADLVAIDPADPGCIRLLGNGRSVPDPRLRTCKVRLRAGAPVEPLVLRAAAGECLQVTLRNRLPALVPDLAGFKHLPSTVARDAAGAEGVTTFNNNLIHPSSYVGLQPTLVAFDVELAGGTVIGANRPSLVAPGQVATKRWYAGDLSFLPASGTSVTLVATPVEFGGANLLPADQIKQGAKGLEGALVVQPPGATWTESDLVPDNQSGVPGAQRETRASATVNGQFRDFTVVAQKGLNHRYADGAPMEMIAAVKQITEDAEDSGHMAINYATEPLSFRFGLAPNTPYAGPFGFSAIQNIHQAYSNDLPGVGGDPATPVFTVPAGSPFRLHLLMPTGSPRASVMTLHGHVWQREPHVCPGTNHLGIPGKCAPTGFFPTLPGFEVASKALGDNPLSVYMGAQDLFMPGAHFELVLPSAGGSNGIPGDYLLHDRGGMGSMSGLWGLVRVTP
ncbi:MAG: hypothetical protein IPO09_07480 [Anaeromyxobacter sp.]|nr:hypothetical protein [Anaeromyxobacter sp.]MBL0277905.1 hypothetical protein [Anaeromyxobacter sp.]